MYKCFFKRFFDIVISGIAMIVLSPLYLLLALYVAVFMGLPVLFSQERIGKGEKPFKLYKFRSMTNKKDEKGNLLPERERLTKAGIFLRNSSLDELPELWSIFIGKMSIVGPRPMPTYYGPYFLPEERKRHTVRGGLIPPDSLSGKAVTTYEEQFKYECDYAENVSLWLDIKVIFTTFKILFLRVEEDYGTCERPHLNVYRKDMKRDNNRIMDRVVKELIEKNGTPFYLFDEKGFVENYKKLENTFKAIYPDYQISYSYKTNYTPFICQLVKSLGGYAEVVSDMEYTLARKLGYKNCQIVYNGPSKGDEMYEHLENGGILNIDSLDEAKRVVAYCLKNGSKQYTCGIRINMDLGANFISRFGMVDGSPELLETVKIIHETENLKLIGLHCHISRCRGVDAWAQRAQIMLAMADKYVEGVPEYISLGSGMFADMADYLKDQFGGNSVPTYDDYAEVTIRPFAEHYKDCKKKPMLFTEPGTTVVARYLSFVSKVLSIKNVRGRWIANMDGDYHNLGEICTMKKLPTEVIPSDKPKQHFDKIDIMGFTCLEQDVMVPEWSGDLAEGDIVVFENVGGYSIVSKPQFIKPQSAMYVKRINGEVKQIMRAETFGDVFNKFSFEF